MKVKDGIHQIEGIGWFYCGTKGSHHHWKHPTKAGKVTIPGRPNDILAPGTWASIKRQAGLSDDIDNP